MSSKHRRDCVAVCLEAGLNVLQIENRGVHIAVVCSEGRIFMPCTPSDHRWRKNAYSVARRMGKQVPRGS